MIQLSPGKLWGMRRMADAAGRFKMTAVDQRPPIKNPIARHYGLEEAPYDDVARFKALLIETLQAESTAMLLDPHYAIPRGIDLLSPKKGLIVTLEDSEFRETEGGRLSSRIDDWSVEKIKRMGGDAVKVLAWYRPDADESNNAHQQDFVKGIGGACARFDIPFLLELLVYPFARDAYRTTDYVEMRCKKADDVLTSVEEFARPDYGVDVFKLESPVAAADVPGVGGRRLAADPGGFRRDGADRRAPLGDAVGRRRKIAVPQHPDPRVPRRGVGLSRRARHLARRLCAFPRLDTDKRGTVLRGVAYMRDLNALTDSGAAPWTSHPCFGEGGACFQPRDQSFSHSYPGY